MNLKQEFENELKTFKNLLGSKQLNEIVWLKEENFLLKEVDYEQNIEKLIIDCFAKCINLIDCPTNCSKEKTTCCAAYFEYENNALTERSFFKVKNIF